MRFGVMPPVHRHFLARPDTSAAYAQAAEDAGFESIWAFEHVVIPADYASRYPYNPEGRLTIEDDDLPDPLALLAFLAGVTTQLRLATGVLILPQRSPVICAKECATIDALSNGRLSLGVGVGWLREEAEAVGTSFENRGARTEEAIEAMRILWRAGEATFHGRFIHFDRAKCNPKPVQPGGIPIIVGGHSAVAARRAGRLGDGWYPIGLRAEEFSTRKQQMEAAARDAGRDPSTIEITYGGAPKPELVKRYADQGVTRWVVPVWARDLESNTRALHETAKILMRP